MNGAADWRSLLIGPALLVAIVVMAIAERSLVLNDKETQLLPSFENFGPCQRDGVCSALHRVDYADLYFQHTRSESWSLDEGIVKSGSFSIDQGAPVTSDYPDHELTLPSGTWVVTARSLFWLGGDCGVDQVSLAASTVIVVR